MRRRTRNSLSATGAPATELHRWLSSLMIIGVLAMIPWTVYLAIRLPGHFTAHNWDVTWVGFDGALILVLAATAWAAWYRRQVLAATSIVAATMLLCDTWFDINTSIGTKGQVETILTGLLANVPMALFFIWLARRIMLRTASVLAAEMGAGQPPHHVHEVFMPFATTWRAQELKDESSQPPGGDAKDRPDSAD